jgi:hypothetical protein
MRMSLNVWAARIFITLIILPMEIVIGFAGEFARAAQIGWLNARMTWQQYKLLWSDPWQ